MGTINVNNIAPESGTTVTLGASGDTITLPSGATLAVASGATISNSGTASGFGKVLQVVSTLKVDGFSTAGATFVDVTGLSVTITPSSTSSKIYIISHVVSGGPNLIAYPWKLYRDSTHIAVSTAGSGGNTYTGIRPGTNLHPWSMSVLDEPSTTSAITYKWQTNASGGDQYVNYGSNGGYNGTSGITAMEIAG